MHFAQQWKHRIKDAQVIAAFFAAAITQNYVRPYVEEAIVTVIPQFNFLCKGSTSLNDDDNNAFIKRHRMP